MSHFFAYLSQKRSSGISFLTGCTLPALWDLPGLINNFYIIRPACTVVNCFFQWEGRKFISQCRTEGFSVYFVKSPSLSELVMRLRRTVPCQQLRHSSEWEMLRAAGIALLAESCVTWVICSALPCVGLVKYLAFTWVMWYFFREFFLTAAGKRKGSTTYSFLLDGKTSWGHGFILVRSSDLGFYFHALTTYAE